MGEFFFFLLSFVIDLVELNNVFDELFLRERFREEEALNHLRSKGEDEVLLFLGLNAFLDGA